MHVICGHLHVFGGFCASTDLDRLDGSASSVLPEDFDHLVLRQRRRETQQQTGGDWRAEKVMDEASREDRTGSQRRGGEVLT